MFLLLMAVLNDETPAELVVPDELIYKIAQKDSKALEELYQKTNKAVYGFAYSILKNSYDAQDVLQDVFVKVYTAAHTYKGQGKPMAWIFTITRNLALLKIRQEKRTGVIDTQETQVEDTYQQDGDIENKLLLEMLLNTLSDEDRQIVVLHAFSGMKHKEIAQIMQLNLSTVLSKHNRALKKMRNILQEDSGDDR